MARTVWSCQYETRINPRLPADPSVMCPQSMTWAGASAHTHGLVTHRSNRDEDDRVDPVIAKPRQQLRTVPLEGRAVAAVGRGTVKTRRHLADPPGHCKTPQRRQREPGVAVRGARMGAVV